MATIVNTPGSSNDSSAGWAVAVVVLLLVVAGGWYAWAHSGSRAAPSTANINVTLPSMDDGGTGGAGAPAQ